MNHKVGYVPALQPSAGGMYQYSLTMLDGLQALAARDSSLEVVITSSGSGRSEVLRSQFRTMPIEPPGPRVNIKGFLADSMRRPPFNVIMERLVRRRLNKEMNPDSAPIERPRARAWLTSSGIEAMIYSAPDRRSFEIGIPYVMCVHDLQHRRQPEFPEVSHNGEFERREYLYRNAARTARLLVVDSITGLEDLLEFYEPFGAQSERIRILPFVPPPYLLQDDQLAHLSQAPRSDLPDNFLFYPAQFWPHKNHERLIRALCLLREETGLRPPLVLTGASSGSLRRRTFKRVMRLARELSVARQITYLGYVSGDRMFDLYRRALGLVFPTFFGPTNIPIVEAWSIGCPVLTSDLRGIREQAGDAAVLVDPRSVEALADGMRRLVADETLRAHLRTKGRERLSCYTKDDYITSLKEIISIAISS